MRMEYGQRSLETYERPTVYSGGGIRYALSRAARDAWSSPEGDAMRQELSRAGRQMLGAGYSRALQGARSSLSQIAHSSGYADQVRRIWGTA